MFGRLAVVAASLALLVPSAANADEASKLSELIDRQIESRLDAEGVSQAPEADDAEFLRRVFLDLHGVVPSAERAVEFLDDEDPEKRSGLIEELLADRRFGERQGDLWRSYLVSPLADGQPMQGDRFAAHLADRFNSDAGWDAIAFELLTATGTQEENPAVVYLIEGRHPLGVADLTDLTSRYFLGVQLNCAQCHDHPFVDDLKQQDYWGMAAFFAEIQTPGRPKAVYRFGIQDDPQIVMTMLDDDAVVEAFRSQEPTFLGGERWNSDGAARRVALARWMTSPGNPYFAKAAVNRVWQRFFGRGIVNPVDDMHAGNIPSHPELLELLSQRFVDSGFDLKFLCRAILQSETYQRSSLPGDQPELQAELFGRMTVKTLTPEQLYDSLVTVLGPPERTKGSKAVQDPRDEFCRYFAGDGDPDSTRYERGIPHVLRLMNSPQFAGSEFASRISRSGGDDDEKIEQTFLAVLSRRPSPEELRMAKDHLDEAGGSSEAAYRELAWALLMSSEFMFER